MPTMPSYLVGKEGKTKAMPQVRVYSRDNGRTVGILRGGKEGSSTVTPWKKTIVLKNIPDEFSGKDIDGAIAQAMFILIVRKNYMGIKDKIKEKKEAQP